MDIQELMDVPAGRSGSEVDPGQPVERGSGWSSPPSPEPPFIPLCAMWSVKNAQESRLSHHP